MMTSGDLTWIKVHPWDEKDAEELMDQDWQRYQGLLEHHYNECDFLLRTIRELAKELYEYRTGWWQGVDYPIPFRLNAPPSGYLDLTKLFPYGDKIVASGEYNSNQDIYYIY